MMLLGLTKGQTKWLRAKYIKATEASAAKELYQGTPHRSLSSSIIFPSYGLMPTCRLTCRRTLKSAA